MTNAPDIMKKAYWIWPGERLFNIRNTYAHFRKDFSLKVLPTEAKLYITADQSYRLWVNGKYITRGPARGYQSHWPYDTVDISGALKEGNNYICVEAYNPGVSTFSYIFQSAAGFLCACDLGETIIKSDESWICRYDKAHKRDTAHYSIQLAFQEHVDAREDDRNWINSSNPPEGWGTPKKTAFGSMPWHDLEERGIPLLGQKSRTPWMEVSRSEGSVLHEYRDWYNIAKGLHNQFAGAVWTETKQAFSSEGFAVSMPAAGKGRYRAVVIDMGETVAGPCSISVNGGKSGEIVDIFFHELIDVKNAPVLSDPDALHSRISMANRLMLRKGTTSYDFYQILGFRYITVVLQENENPVSFSLSILDTGYPYQIQGAFESSDEILNGIWKICLRTQRVCSLDAYVDTPWREQAQWWGDARIQFWNTMAFTDDTRLLKRGIRSIAGQSVPNGLTYGHAPTKAHTCILPDFSLIWIMTIYDYYRQTGDISLFEEQLPRIRQVFSYFEEEAPRNEGLLSHDARYWLFLDWSTLKKNETPALYNMWYLIALQTMEKMLELAGKNSEAAEYSSKAGKLRRIIEEKLFDPAMSLFCDGLDSKGVPYSQYSVHSQTLAVALGLKPEHHPAMFEKRILPFLRGEKLDDPVPSTYWTSYVISVSRENGYHREALEFIRRMWAPMISHSTCWEDFNPIRGSKAMSHAWSAHPLFHLQNILGGIVQDSVAWNTIRFEPYFDDAVNYVHVKVPTPLGTVESSWERKGENIHITLRMPDTMKASIKLPSYTGIASGSFDYTVVSS